MKFGIYNAVLHDRSLPDAIEVISKLGPHRHRAQLGRLPACVHIPTFDDILSSASRAR
jgi:hypothetical protein